tara:strand:- start:1191 stop:2864 length:1674 start_codon:yes stop_codon:yes gene_type:complete
MDFFNNFKKSDLTYHVISSLEEINIDEINQGISQNEHYLFYRDKELIKIYDRFCNHKFGRLFLKGNIAICPLHEWELDLKKEKYINASCTKEPLLIINENELDSPFIEIEHKKKKLDTLSFSTKKNLTIRFINHACLHFAIDNEFSFATDPWIVGSAFCNGWWLTEDSPSDAFDILNNCDFIYISHNHPDHLHPKSLKYLRKNMPILTAGFTNESTVRLLKECGFNNITVMDLTSRFIHKDSEFSIAVLKSGDFREDSGILIEIGEFKGLLTVDSNLLNFGRLPDIDLLASSFASGASGFPLCFQNYTQKEKELIIERNKKAVFSTNLKTLKLTNPKYFMPYAGFFTSKAERDRYINKYNKKNSVEDFSDNCMKNNCQLLNNNENQVFKFYGKKLKNKFKDNSSKYIDNSYYEYLTRESMKISKDEFFKIVINYFSYAEFKDNLVLDLITTCDNFSKYFERLKFDFSSKKIEILDINISTSILEEKTLFEEKKYLQIKVRREELIDVIVNCKPWEDLSIGFQCRVYRNPNIYNSEFWFYFTNVHVSKYIFLKDKIKS